MFPKHFLQTHFYSDSSEKVKEEIVSAYPTIQGLAGLDHNLNIII